MELKLGKKAAKYDPRTIPFKKIIKKELLPSLPDEWEFSQGYPGFDLSPQMWGNDEKGDCVFVASIAQQRDFEVIEQGKVIPVDTDQLIQAYLKEADGDWGLVMLEHMNEWRKNGLPIGSKKFLCMRRPVKYKIHAFASVDWKDKREMMYATFLLGCNIGASLPQTYEGQFDAGHPWDDTSWPPIDSYGHAMKVRGWTKDGLILWTWGKLQLATWPWVSKYFDEAYAIVDDPDSFPVDFPLDLGKLEGYLAEITK